MTFLKILPFLGLVTFRAVSAPPESAGFTSLFDGKTWAGWDHPAHIDGVWEIADGVIRLRTDQPKRVSGKDYNLSTARRYKNFTLMLDWRLTGKPVVKPHRCITKDGQYRTDATGKLIMEDNLTWCDSGIYLRGLRAAQGNIWCQPFGSGEVGTKFKDLTEPKPCVGAIIGMIDAIVLLDGGRVGQQHRIAVGLEAIDEPIPIEGRLDSDPPDAVPVRLEVIDNGRQLARQLCAADALPVAWIIARKRLNAHCIIAEVVLELRAAPFRDD